MSEPARFYLEVHFSPQQIALIDALDIDLLLARRWYPIKNIPSRTYYLAATARRKHLLFHRLITDAVPGQEVDHRNGNGLDNRRHNLRGATRQQNSQHMLRLRTDNTLGFRGVTFDHRRRNPFRAQIFVDGHRKTLGRFATAQAAADVYDEAARKFYGEFAGTNAAIRALRAAEGGR